MSFHLLFTPKGRKFEMGSLFFWDRVNKFILIKIECNNSGHTWGKHYNDIGIQIKDAAWIKPLELQLINNTKCQTGGLFQNFQEDWMWKSSKLKSYLRSIWGWQGSSFITLFYPFFFIILSLSKLRNIGKRKHTEKHYYGQSYFSFRLPCFPLESIKLYQKRLRLCNIAHFLDLYSRNEIIARYQCKTCFTFWSCVDSERIHEQKNLIKTSFSVARSIWSLLEERQNFGYQYFSYKTALYALHMNYKYLRNIHYYSWMIFKVPKIRSHSLINKT